MELCLIAGGKALVVAGQLFTLAWTHSVEKIEWQEDWRVTAAGLEILEARVKGSGAGMEPPEGARFDGEWWRYRPSLPPQAELLLARSDATVSGWLLCSEGRCTALPESAADGEPAVLRACAG